MPWVLMALGAALALGALFMLLQTPDVLQYAALAPEAGEQNATINASLDRAREVVEAQRSNYRSMALGGGNGSVRIASETGSAQVNLIGMDEGWLEVYPRFLKRGRRISEVEIQHGTAVVMLDEDLLVKLFGSSLPEEASVRLNDAVFRVVGSVRHAGSLFGGRGVGDAVMYDAYIPLRAAVSNGIPLKTLTLSAAPRDGTGWANTFLAGVGQWTPDGHLIDLGKETMRRTMILRILLLIVGLYALYGLFLRLTDRVTGWFAGFRDALRRSYFSKLIPRLLGIVGLTLLCYGALVGATWLLLSFSVQPVYTFTEWVPENFVEWSSITKVFWNLVASSAGLVRVATRELRVVEFWGALLRWGVILALLGAALLQKAGSERKKK